MTIDVSVFINNYNHGRYLPQAQEFSEERMEIIVVDDGSSA